MTAFTTNHPPKSTVIGAYSLWPRRSPTPRRVAIAAATAGSAAVFIHCALPFIAGA